ncbi:MAG: nickel pincer cofactor biosynthesis protein LarB [Deltaproteobacteria bacterium]|nr:nickel pincer cofactor biosynthesis protein LarB [Deltaproteobacteria bacterium]
MTGKDKFQQVFLDGEREGRNGFSEAVFCEGKSLEQIQAVIAERKHAGQNVLGTRCPPEAGEKLVKLFQGLTYYSLSRTFQLIQTPPAFYQGSLGILAAGTADVPVAEEAWQTAKFYGLESHRFYDVGVAGLHRLLSQIDEIRKMDVLIAVAGMEGALPSVVAGLVKSPVIACPTSVGYGAHFKGLTTLLAMMNSCSEGITVVNIDNGFGAACAALRIFRGKNAKRV